MRAGPTRHDAAPAAAGWRLVTREALRGVLVAAAVLLTLSPGGPAHADDGAAPAGVVGTVLPVAPQAPPGRVAPLPADPLRAAIDRRTQGDLGAAGWYYQQLLDRRMVSGRTKAAVQLALGLVWLDQGDDALAAAMFSTVSRSGTPVASYGTWYLATAEHRRGQGAAAARACSTYRSKWPQGPFADECLVLMGDAYAAEGKRSSAVASYRAYLDKHPDSPRAETLQLGIALAVSTTDPKSAIPLLQDLAVDHEYHSTGESARARLAALQAEGWPAAIPETTAWRCREALELKRCGYGDAAWESYRVLAQEAEDDPALQRWIEAQEERFAWGTKQYEALAASLAEQNAATPSAELAWSRYKALSRAGLWPEAVQQLEAGRAAHPTSGRFRRTSELYARGLLLAGRYADARDQWSALGKSGGGVGREARWLAAYAAFRTGDASDALVRLNAVVDGGGDEALAARYYRARALDQLGRAAEAEAERASILQTDPYSWYAALLRSEGLRAAGPSAATPGSVTPVTGATTAPPVASATIRTARDGRWPGPVAPHLPPLAPVGTQGAGVSAPRVGEAEAEPGRIRWQAVAWSPSTAPAPLPAASPSPARPAVAPLGPTPILGEARPDSYQAGFLFEPAEGDRLLCELGERNASVFPLALAAADLARAGIYHESAPIVARMYDAIEAARDRQSLPADPALGPGASGDALRAIALTTDEWRQIFYFVRDDYHAARFSWGTTRMASTPEERAVALRRQFPTAQIDALYRQGEAQDVDPFLMLGLMRQESVYRQWALSPVGAIGLLQVMPRTGARVAALMGDRHYSPEVLEDPATNVRYGVWYMGRLLDRFGGAFPLAVASYNGGPHNVGSWLRPWGSSIRMDDLVEQMPYGETRDYVKKVTGYYATYLDLYGPPGSRVEVPAASRGDRPEVIDF